MIYMKSINAKHILRCVAKTIDMFSIRKSKHAMRETNEKRLEPADLKIIEFIGNSCRSAAVKRANSSAKTRYGASFRTRDIITGLEFNL